ncbi:hypothetical protein AURDEDRAFT_160274 [Auricularia subglabra TFB-10046 SS5]|nr:hypothetical protein AURDEDRAFT_160274 [Auricularia subglabra TFB-10046 SS5]
MENWDVIVLKAPKVPTIALPYYNDNYHAIRAYAGPAVPPTVPTSSWLPHVVAALHFNLADSTFWWPGVHDSALLSVQLRGTFAVRHTPGNWFVTMDAPTPLGDILSAVHSMLRWSMSGIELALYAHSEAHYWRVATQCAARCAGTDEEYRGAQSQRRIDWLLGRTRLASITWRVDLQAWLLDVSA